VLERNKIMTISFVSDKKDVVTGEAMEILNHWNSLNIMKHRPTTKRLSYSLNRALNQYSKDDIIQSISNYATVLHDKSYVFDHIWKLSRFVSLDNALPDFLPDGEKWINYNNFISKQKKPDIKPPVVVEKITTPHQSEIYAAYMDYIGNLPYDEYLKTEHWQHFRKQALKDSHYSCRLCDTKDVELNVHHKTYRNLGRETFLDIVVLCVDCHSKFHNVFVDKE